MPRLIPVIDLLHGQVVRAVGGRREEYKPIVSQLTTSTDPMVVQQAIRQATGANELYLADLDAIERTQKISAVTFRLAEACDCPIWLDAGIGRTDLRSFPTCNRIRPVVGSETCSTAAQLLEALSHFQGRCRAFSVDMKNGVLQGDWQGWQLRNERDVLGLVGIVVSMRITTVILIDLDRVGSGTGPGTVELIRDVRRAYPEVELFAGGGIRSWHDVKQVGEAGATGVLVGSAIHDRTLESPRPTQGQIES